MAQIEKSRRLPVSLNGADTALYIAIKHSLETKGQKTYSAADVVREALRALAAKEGVTVA